MKYKEAIEEIKNRVSIVEVIKQYVPLKQTGSSFIGLCPFHADKNPSMSVSDSLKIFKCFACNEAGDVFKFLSKYLNISYFEAVKMLAKTVNVEIDNDYANNENYKKREEKKQKLYELNKDVANAYYKFLHSDIGIAAYQYLTNERHLTDETIFKFGLGYAPKDPSLLYNILKEKGYDDETLIESKLFKLNDNNAMINFFFNRVIFPVVDIYKHIIGFQSRVLDKNQKEFKYLNSKTTEIFQKDSILYAFNFAINSKEDYYILCEGNMDVISLHQAGFDNAIAAQGTSFNEKHIFLLKRKPKKIYLCQDMDGPGIIAKNRIADMLNKSSFETYMIDLSPVKDVDEFLNDSRLGKDELKKRLLRPIQSILYYVSTAKLGLNLDDPYDFEKYINLIVKKLANIKNSIIRDDYIKKSAMQENIDASKLNSLVNNYLKGNHDSDLNYDSIKNNHTTDITSNKNSTSTLSTNKYEAMFINLIFNNDIFRDEIIKSVSANEIGDEICKLLYNKYVDGVKIDEIYNYISTLDDNTKSFANHILNTKYEYEDLNNLKVVDILNQVIRNLKIAHINKTSNGSLDSIYQNNIKIKQIQDTTYII